MPPLILAGAASVSFGEDDVKKRVGKKLQKKRHEPNNPTVELPERLKEGDDAGEEDLVPTQGPPMFMNMNQSIFGLIAAAGSRVDFHDRFESSDEESGEDDDDDRDDDGHHHRGTDDDRHLGQGLFLHRKQRRRNDEPDVAKTTVLKKDPSSKSEKHKRKISGHKLLRSLPALPRLPRHKSKKEPSKLEPPSEEASDASEPPPFQPADDTKDDEAGHRLAPVMSRMLEAKAEMSMRPSFDVDRRSPDQLAYSDSVDSSNAALARRLQDIFEFDHPEAVIEGKFPLTTQLSAHTGLTCHRIPLLVTPKRSAPGLHVHHGEAHLLLRLSAQESGLSSPFSLFHNLPWYRS